VAATILGIGVFAAACGNSTNDKVTASTSPQTTLRLGFFPNLTHAPALVGVEKGIFKSKLGSGIKLETKTFNAGPEAVQALFSEAIDATYVGPNPALNSYVKSGGKATRVIAGAASGGAAFVVKKDINGPNDLKDKKLATPSIGNTQDIALRNWLKSKGLNTTKEGGGDVKIQPQDNSQALQAFQQGSIQGAWVPEPYATRMVLEGGGKVLVNEASLWPNGKFPTTVLVVRTKYAKEHPDVVKKLIEGHVAAIDYIDKKEAGAKAAVNKELATITGKALKPDVMDAAWKNIEFTEDPIAAAFREVGKSAQDLGFLDKSDLGGIFDLSVLNDVLTAEGKPKVKS
jgi:NitT/TauT family transport system substrate-binding protein